MTDIGEYWVMCYAADALVKRTLLFVIPPPVLATFPVKLLDRSLIYSSSILLLRLKIFDNNQII